MTATLPVPASVVADLRRARRKQRVAEMHWIDALYQVYLAGIVVVVVVAVLSTVIGDEPFSAAAVRDIRADGAAILGVAVAMAVFVGLRSGSRGGPLAIERPDVRHVLMAPVDRGAALRDPALRQLRFVTFASIATGAAAGQFAGRRFPDGSVAWVGSCALFALTLAGLAYGAALVASSNRVPTWLSTMIGGGLVVWAVADASGASVPAAPSTLVGEIALWPLGFEVAGLAGVVAAAALLALGLGRIAGTSLEAAERRTALVGQIRFAVTVQDLRTVLVLRRQLAADLPRPTPWLPVLRGAGKARFPVWQRDWRGLLRFPLPRIARLVVLGVIAGVVLAAVWNGTSPLVILVGMALWVAALDAVEPLSQETDHPGRLESYPLEEGRLMVAHLPAPMVVMAVVTVVACAVASVIVGTEAATETFFLSAVPLGVGAACGAVVSVLMGAPKPFDDLAVASPEIAGMRTVLRTIWPPLLACMGTACVLLGRAAADDSQPVAQPVLRGAFAVVAVATLVGGWVRFRSDIKAWWAQANEAMVANQSSSDDDEHEERP